MVTLRTGSCRRLTVCLICDGSFGRQLVEEAAQLCSAKVRRTDTPTASGGSAGAAAGGGGGGGGAGGSGTSSATEDASATSGSGPGRVRLCWAPRFWFDLS